MRARSACYHAPADFFSWAKVQLPVQIRAVPPRAILARVADISFVKADAPLWPQQQRPAPGVRLILRISVGRWCKGSRVRRYSIISVAAFTGAGAQRVLALRWTDPVDQQDVAHRRAIEETGDTASALRTKKTISVPLRSTMTCSPCSSRREKHYGWLPRTGRRIGDLGLVKLPGCLDVPQSSGWQTFDPDVRVPRFARKAKRLQDLRLHDLRGSHETMLLDAGVPVHVVAARCGHDLRQHSYEVTPSAPARPIRVPRPSSETSPEQS